MSVNSDSKEEIESFILKAQEKFWHIWINGYDVTYCKYGAYLYKPTFIEREWQNGQ